MSIFLVTIEHPDERAWQEWIAPHVRWLEERVADATVIASGPTRGTDVRKGLLVMSADDEPSLMAILKTDPFWVHGVVAAHAVVGWDPVFGALRSLSSAPEGITAEQMRG